MAAPEGFEYKELGETVVIYHRGRKATVLRGDRAVEFLGDVESEDGSRSPADQELMARLKEADANGDGKLSKEEAPGMMKENFDRIDANSDGFVHSGLRMLLST